MPKNSLLRARHALRWNACLAAMLSIGIPCDAYAAIITDSSLGHPAQTLNGPGYLIPETLGKLSGSNLFHSFQTFSIATGESASFTTATPGIANVISRVTGGSLSQINGLLSLTPCTGCGAPNFFFINPAGVTFGAGASIDVPGAFHVSTADYVKFPDGNFSADLSQASSFSSAPPEAFGFLGTTRASITVNGGAALKTKPMQPISVIAGDLELNHGSIITRNGGDIRVAAVGQGVQEVGFVGALPTMAGSLSIRNGGRIYSITASANNGGAIKAGAGSITIDNLGYSPTGIFSETHTGTGNSGSVEVAVADTLSIVNGGRILSGAFSASFGNAGAVKINAGSISIDAGGNTWGGIFSTVDSGTAGRSGTVDVTSQGLLSLMNNGSISSQTFGLGDAQAVRVNAGSIAIDRGVTSGLSGGGISSYAQRGSAGNAGIVDVNSTGSISIVNSGCICSETRSTGSSNSVSVHAGNITIEDQDLMRAIGYSRISGSSFGNGLGGNVDVFSTGKISLVGMGQISSDVVASTSTGGLVKVSADSISIDGLGGGGSFFGNISSSSILGGDSGSIEVSAVGDLSIVNGGLIWTESKTETYGRSSVSNAGAIKVTAGSIHINRGSISTRSMSPEFQLGVGDRSAGAIEVSTTGNLSIIDGDISSSTDGAGSAGNITVKAGTLLVDGGWVSASTSSRSASFSTIVDYFDSRYHSPSSGQSGSISVTATDNIALNNGGAISTYTSVYGSATNNWVPASLSVTAPIITLNGGYIYANTYGGKDAGNINISATRLLSINNGGQISSDTTSEFSAGNAGTVNVNAGDISIDGQGSSYFTGISSSSSLSFSKNARAPNGNAGSVAVTSTGNLSILNGGVISSSTAGYGHAGNVAVAAVTLSIDGQGNSGFTGITSSSVSNTVNGTYGIVSEGNAGSVAVTSTANLAIVNGGAISSNTAGRGSAGAVTVTANKLLVDGVSSSISASVADIYMASGQTGSVSVIANDLTLSSGGQISIANQANVADSSVLTPTSINVTSPRITILNSPNAITTASTGNVAAGSININASDSFNIDPSGITTTSILGNGGAINIQAGMLSLVGSQIATSVTGPLNGNGGNISIAANALVLNTGFILANTAAPNAIGGTISIATQNMIASGNTLFLGGNTPYTYTPGIFGFNVIQAAAPTGLSGTVQTTSPVLDVSGSLGGLYVQVIDTGGFSRSPCQATGGSSLVQSGRGGLPPSARGLLRAESPSPPINAGYFSPANGDFMRLASFNGGCT